MKEVSRIYLFFFQVQSDITKRAISTTNSPTPDTFHALEKSALLILSCLLSPNKNMLLTHTPRLLRLQTEAKRSNNTCFVSDDAIT